MREMIAIADERAGPDPSTRRYAAAQDEGVASFEDTNSPHPEPAQRAESKGRPRAPTMVWVVFAALAVLFAAPVRAASDQQQVVDHAMATVSDLKGDPSFGNSKELLQRAKAVMIVPELVKGGFFLGGEGGSGVLLVKTADGWSDPAFYTLGAASFGLQIGLETAEIVFFVMSDKALSAWMKNEVKLGAQAGLTVLVVGSNAEAAATTNARADVIAWAKSKGAYAGLTLEGSLIKPRESYNTAYYGKKATPTQIVKTSGNPGAAALRSALAAP